MKFAPNFRIIASVIILLTVCNITFSQNQDINIPESGNIGSVALNVPTDFVLTIENTHSGGSPSSNQLTVTGITISGTNASEFVVSGITFPVTINRSNSTTFIITFTATASGTRTALLSVASDDPDENPYDLNLSGVGDATLTSISLTNTYSLSVLEPSGLTFDSANNQLFTVSDNTGLVYRLSTSGTILETLSYSGSDLEGVSMYTTDKLLIAVEGSRELIEYDYVVDDGTFTSHVMSYSNTDLSSTGDNSRIEGVSYDSVNDVIYFLNEKNPGALIKANGSFSVTNEYPDPLAHGGDYSGSYYVEETGELWLASDQTSTIYKCTTDGTIIQTFPITTSGGANINKLEGIAIDYANQLLYAVSDAGQELYVFDINDPNFGDKLDFDGVDDHIDYGDTHDLTGSFSLEAWILQEATVVTGTMISKVDIRTGAGNQRGYCLSLNNNLPTLIWYDNSGTKSIELSSPYAITNNKWYHIASTYDGSTAKLYIDGVVVASGAPSASPFNGTESFILGAMYDSDTPTVPKNYFDGYIDEVRVWGVALSKDQLREMMNQEISQNGTAVRGKVIPIDISGGLLWSNLKGYYPMTDDKPDDKSSNSFNGTAENMTTSQQESAPLPYTTIRDGQWSDASAATPWTLGDSAWNTPNSISIDGSTSIDWNIVQSSHNLTSGDNDITVLGLITDTASTTFTISDPVDSQDETNSGQSLEVTHYLEMDGDIDLIGESQLIQSEGSILDQDSGGSIEQDQQGTASSYNYNYWSSSMNPITSSGLGQLGTGVASTNSPYTLSGILKDGTTSSTPVTINFQSSHTSADGSVTSPITISSYWLWKFNGTSDDYASWESINESSSLSPGEGYTMKGSSGSASISTAQNYVYKGKPNNGDITLAIALDDNRLIGNPYPSAIDADEFILDNISDGSGRAGSNIINGALYFWDHFSGSTHNLGEYVGGYATYTLMGGVSSISNDVRINNNGATGTKVPKRYIPVNQGFFVSAALDSDTANTTATVTGGTVSFKNSQRIFKTESLDPSVMFRSTDTRSNNGGVDGREKIRIMFDSPTGYHRQLLVGVDQDATQGYDLGLDAMISDINVEDMFWRVEGENYVIQAVNNFEQSQVFPLGLIISEDGIATIRIDELENISRRVNIFIHDLETNRYHNLRAREFNIFLSIGEYLDRFEIVFNEPNESRKEIDKFTTLQVHYINEGDYILLLNSDLIKVEQVELFNILGQSLLITNEIPQENHLEIKAEGLSSGTYIVKLKTKDGELSKKILIK